jgi:hypothetical protein
VSAPPDLISHSAEQTRVGTAFLAVGLAALAVSAVLWSMRTSYRGMIPTLTLPGLVEIAIGATIARRTRLAAPRAGLESGEKEAREVEIRRLRRMMSWFRVLKAAELVMLTAGLTLLMLFPRGHPLFAAGLGGILQGSSMLVLDRLAERRVADYAAALARPG